jgi:hypothetical protein
MTFVFERSSLSNVLFDHDLLGKPVANTDQVRPALLSWP